MKFDKSFIPKTIDEAIDCIVNSLHPEDIENIKKRESGDYHFSIGMFLRNNWNMWDNATPMSIDFQNRFKLFGHGDDLSGVILEGVWAKVNNKDVNEVLTNTANGFRLHWINEGLDPVTGKED